MIEGEEGADGEGGILTENIIRLNAIESTALDDIEKNDGRNYNKVVGWKIVFTLVETC